MSNPKQRTASERIEDLENAMLGAFQNLDSMMKDLDLVKKATQLLNGKIDAVIKAGSISDQAVSDAMVEAKANILKSKVDDMVASKILVAEDAVTATSFVVGRELDKSGTVMDPRVQIAIGNIPEDLQNKLVGTIAGQIVDMGEGNHDFQIIETYSIVTPNAPEAETPQETPSEAASG